MNNTRKESLLKKLNQKMLSLKYLVSEGSSSKPRMIGLAAVIFVLVLVLIFVPVLTVHSRKEPVDELLDATMAAAVEDIEPTITSDAIEPQPVGIPADMGTICTDNLSICKDPGIDIDVEEYYTIGDRVEIHETKKVNGTLWGYTGKGWIRMDSVRMDDVRPANFDGTEIVSNGSSAVLGYGVVDLKALNVRVGPGTDYTKIKEIPQGIRYAYYEVSDEWVRIGDGWVSTLYFYVEGTAAEDATTGTITTNDLNVRTGPDTSFKRVNSYMEGDSVEILAVVNGWGYTEKGWISMMYVKLPDPVYITGNATVTVGLNIREAPDPASAKIDVYKEGDYITIIEVNNGWGKTDKGWINLDYVKYD